MSDERERKLEEEIRRGNEANLVLGSPVYADSMKKMKQAIIDQWAACPARDTAGREWLWQHYQVALKFEETMTEVLNTGKLALKEREMTLLEKAANRLRLA